MSLSFFGSIDSVLLALLRWILMPVDSSLLGLISLAKLGFTFSVRRDGALGILPGTAVKPSIALATTGLTAWESGYDF